MKHKLVAVVDNDTAFLELVRRILDHTGYDSLLIDGSEGALDLIRSNQPDVIMLDMWLEDRESGLRVLEQLGADERTRRIPVILCTASTDELTSRRSSLHADGYHCLAKPFELNDLLELLENVVHKSC